MCIKAGIECVSHSHKDSRSDARAGSETHNVRPASSNPPEERPAKIRRLINNSSHPDRRPSLAAKAGYRNRFSPPGRPNRADSIYSGDARRTDYNGPDRGDDDGESGADGGEDGDVNGRVRDEDNDAAIIDDYDLEANMNTNMFTLTPGHLMESTIPSVQQQQHEPYRSPVALLAARSGLANDRGGGESMVSPSATSSIIDPQYRAVLPWTHARASAASLLTHLPPRPVADYLVAVYFNTVHWFMVVLHEGHFIHNYKAMMDLYAQDPKLVSNTDEDFTFVVLVLTVVVLGGRYTPMHSARARRCKEIYAGFCRSVPSYATGNRSEPDTQFDIVKTTSLLFSVVRSNTTDNVACGTLATVQSLLLLGSLCLFHGESNLSWAYSGLTIRTAQALGLHRDGSERRWNSPYYERMSYTERCQLRRRLFWAVHTGDRFLAMCYGLPLLMSDDDCLAGTPCEDDVYPLPGCSSFLMIEDDLAAVGPAANGRPVTLLTYQTYKLHIYIILGEIISSIYRPSNGGRNPILSRFEPKATGSEASSQPQKEEGLTLIETAQRLEAKLRNWYNDLPPALRLSDDMSYPPYKTELALAAASTMDGDEDVLSEDDEIIIPASDDLLRGHEGTQRRRRRLRTSIYGLQALLLQLAYDNALILIHRPILALRTSTGTGSSNNPQASAVTRDAFSRSVDACWRAALRISRIGGHHIFDRGLQAHAVSYVGIHLFMAGVVISVFANSNPLGRRAWEAKQGLRRIIRMQRRLRRKVVVSGQGLAILENLAREVVRKEIRSILAHDEETDGEEQRGRGGGQGLDEARKRGGSADGGHSSWDWNGSVNAAATVLQSEHEPSPWGRGGGATEAGAWQSTSGGLARPRQSSFADLNTNQPLDPSSGGLLTGFMDDSMLETDMFNESVLDIEKRTYNQISCIFLPAHTKR